MLDQSMRQSQAVERRAPPPPPPPPTRGEPYVPDRPTSPPQGHRFRGGGDEDEDGLFAGRSRMALPDQSEAMNSAVGSERRMHDLQRTTSKRGRKEDFANEPPPPLYSIHKGSVKNVQSFGAFVAMDGFQKHGLVHISQLADFRVDDVKSAVSQGQSVWVKVVSIDNEAGKIALSMKYVDQHNGKDLDDLNERIAEEGKRGPGETRARPPILKVRRQDWAGLLTLGVDRGDCQCDVQPMWQTRSHDDGMLE
jgi:predicted RNA-binding protein with RPS1 domain